MFNPFEKQIDSLSETDLQGLIDREVAEGLYVEYKREFPTRMEKIGQSLASFANTNGGWYLVGVDADRQTNAAKALSGIDLAIHKDPISKVREITKAHIDPFPAFEARLVRLSTGHSVLVVEVPDGQDKPFISSNGRIYRRAADSSDPVYERDRYTIDKMYEEGKRFEQRFRESLSEETNLGSDDHRGWLKLLISPYPSCVWKDPELMLQERLAELLKSTSQKRPIGYYSTADAWKGTLPFDTAFATGTSVILRQQGRNPTGLMMLSAELSLIGTAQFDIPIHVHSNNETFLQQLKTAAAQKVLAEHHRLRLIDLGELSLVIASLVTFYQD